MAKAQDAASLEAEHGQKMIEIKLRFWTNDIANEKGKIIPKHAWSKGVVKIEANKAHGIKPKNPAPFRSLLQVGAVIEDVLIAHGIVLHADKRTRKYIEVKTDQE
ncbi:hypothetical protein [Bradyrhizobium sp. AUGA SZCCT0431]|uniref:hypothetical protein n=1 Tax=Bradyrhizobium sp. AUGA SZCCT0431 TaxID=2807674 RepID=UPI001BAC6A83|nr:hypothetical protein [Bradyrhizobium sp. AUGA SZCCT0431]MBR1142719.1 hypothetical protein [Bradyrhizobium sp. AUGA SZCCT0431]